MELGTNNLPDCSNMCHEATGRALSVALGTGKGTVDLVDWEKADCLIVMGVNAASNAPRMLTSLAKAYRRGAQIVHVNPFIEAASRTTIVPHEIASMMLFHPTRIGTLNIQPRIAGDMSLMRGVAKHLLEASVIDPGAIDWRFIERNTAGFETDTGRANFSTAQLADCVPKSGHLILGTVRSHDQWNTTIYSDGDRYRGVKNLRTLVFMNEEDMWDRGLKKYDLVDLTSFAKDGSTRQLAGFRAIPYNLPRGCAMGYMPEMNALCPIGDYSARSDQPLMKHVIVEIRPSNVRSSMG